MDNDMVLVFCAEEELLRYCQAYKYNYNIVRLTYWDTWEKEEPSLAENSDLF